jgi:site-specific recombinase XerD
MYEINLDTAERPLDGRHLERLMDRWLETVAAEVEAGTVAGYRQKIDHFRRWWREAGPALEWQITRSALTAFGKWLAAQPSQRPPYKTPSYGQQKDVLRRVAQMFKWAKTKNFTQIDHSDWLPAPIGEPTLRKAPTLDDLAALMAAAGNSFKPVRNRALLALLIGTGVRRAEAASIQIEDIQFAADGSGVAVVVGKRTKANRSGRRSIAFDATTGAYLIALLDSEQRASGPLFVTDSGARMGYQAIHRVVKRTIRRAGLQTRISGSHDLRRSFATHLARYARTDPDIVADLIRRQLGQANYRTTAEIYTLLDVDDIRDVIVSPLAMITRGGSARPG